MDNDQSLKSLVNRSFDDVSRLIRMELRLGQAEMAERLSHAQNQLIGMFAGMLLGFCGLLTIVQAVVIGLANVMPAWAAAAIVGIALALIAIALIKRNQTQLGRTEMKPRRTMASVRRDKNAVMEHVG